MSNHFTHLHLHTDYSLLDGAITIDKLVAFGAQHSMKALAITDHGNIFGAVKFFQKCAAAKIKPILGMEAYFTEDIGIKVANKKYYHLVLLVQNEVGYKNLCKLISHAYQEGFYFKPRIDYALLERYNEGLIALSACLGGHIPQLLMNDHDAQAVERMDWFLDVFGRDRFYLEVQPEDQPEQAKLNKKLFAYAQEKNISLVATGDCHYATREDHEAHEVMLSIQTHDHINNPNRYTFGACRVHMRTQEEMLELFKDHPQAVWNSGIIADACSFNFTTGKLFFPTFQVPDSYTQESYFQQLCQTGFERLVAQKSVDATQTSVYQARLDLEMQLIITMGFVGYFLIVSDFIQWAYANHIPVGPGRGSVAGSLVAWALQITNIDPIKYNLLFERFLNPERVSMPDIDIDFCIEGRERVIQYIRDRYGHDKVCQIITFGTMMAKGVVKDVARVLGLPFEDSNAITALIPDTLKITLHEALEQEPRLQELIQNNPRAQKIFDIAFRLEGLTRHASKHAAGIVISPEPIDQVLPVYIPSKTDELVTQYAMTELEYLGFLKIDLLGLKNLTLIDRTLKLIEKEHGIIIDSNKIPLDDTKTFQLMSAGKTAGVFQLEAGGIKEILRKLQPDKFEDIIVVNALNRPGPLGSGMVDDYIERRHGRQKITYLFPELSTVLEETYGVIAYQEQVMKIASLIAGYSLGEADILRRAMGKKKVDVMAQQRQLFVQGAVKRKFDQEKAGELFDLMAYFAGYGFNKSHSAAYTLITYHTAYLKAHYTAEFLACLISLEATNAEKMVIYIQEARDMGLTVLPPDINQSHIQFTVVNNTILFGLQGIKNVGLAALDSLLAQRTTQPFADLMDLCKRVDMRTVNKRVLEHLICAGALDCLPGSRAQKYTELTRIMDLASEHKKSLLTGQLGLFAGARVPHGATAAPYTFSNTSSWTDKELLEKELEVIGCYLSRHPLDSYKRQFARLPLISLADAVQHSQQSVLVAGMITNKRIITTKKGDRMAFIQLEDAHGTGEIVLFSRVFNKVAQWLDTHTIFVIKGTLDTTNQAPSCKIKADVCVPLELILQEWPAIERVELQLTSPISEALISTIKQCTQHKGKIPWYMLYQENSTNLCLIVQQPTQISAEIVETLEAAGATVRLCLG